MQKSSTYCVMPHIGLQIQHNGRLSVCNNNDLVFTNKSQEIVQVHRDRLNDSWDSIERQEVKQYLDSGRPHYRCHDCFDKEQGNMNSQRMKLNNLFGDLEPLPSQPRVLIIKPGNICNLACRMCSPEASSAWYSDAYKLAIKNNKFSGSYNDYTRTFSNERDGFHLNNDYLWEDLKKWIPELSFIDIYGGEPFLSTGLFKSLAWAAERNLSSNTSLQLSTNLTIYNEQYLETLSRYKSVFIKVSIDSHDPRQLNYIRYPCDPDEILRNLEKFQNYFKNFTNVELGITLTVTPLNLYYLDEIHESLSQYIPIDDFNTVHTPAQYDIRILPSEIKKTIIDKINIKQIEDFLLQEIDPSNKLFFNFINETKDLDVFRNQKFNEVFPEFYNLIAEYYN